MPRLGLDSDFAGLGLARSRTIENTYPFLPDNNPDLGAVSATGATSTKVSRYL